MPALELVTGFVTAPGGTLTSLTLASGNSLSVRNFDTSKKAWLISAWTQNQVAGILEIRSPRLHDNVHNIRYRTKVASTLPLIEIGFRQLLYPQDGLVVQLSGSGVAGQIETACMLIFYEDLPGSAARFISYDDLTRRGVMEVTAETSHVAGVAGGYSGQVAINSGFDTLQANRDYALIGYSTNLESAAVRWQGIDVGNLGVGGPGNTGNPHVTGNWFLRIAQSTGAPVIPVFNSANRAGILVDVAQNQAGGTSVVNSNLMLLA